MKKIISVFLAVLMVVTAFPLSVFAENTSGVHDSGTCGETYNNLTWTLYNDGELVIDGKGGMWTYTNVNGGPWCTYSCCRSLIKTVTIKDEVTSVVMCAFAQCSNISMVTIGKNVSSISNLAFKSCNKLEKIIVDTKNENYFSDENGILFNKEKTSLIAFPQACAIKEYTIPNTVKYIGWDAFRDCTANKIIISDSVTEIGYDAFWGSAIESITIPNNVQYLGGNLFAYCQNLKNVTINCSAAIPSSTFAGCQNIENFVVNNETHCSSDDYGVLFNSTKTSIIKYPNGNKRKIYEIPNIVTSIESWSFSYADIQSIIIPESVLEIGEGAFSYCNHLKNIFYYGTEEQWNDISINYYDNSGLSHDVKIHYNFSGKIVDPDYIFEDSDYTQTHTVADFESYNALYSGQYFSGTAIPMDGTDGNPDYCIPGLQKNEEMIPQGIAYYPAKDWILISAYNKPKEKASVIYALDKTTGKYVAQFNLLNDAGNISTAHLGGIAVSDNNLYFSYGSSIAYIPLSELDVSIGTIKDITVQGTKSLSSQIDKASASYVTISDGVLYSGNFYSAKDSDYNKKANAAASSVIVGYQLSGTDSASEWNNIDTSSPYRKYELQHDGQLSEIQSAIVKDGYLFMSSSFGRNNNSTLYIKEVGDAPFYSFGSADLSCSAMPMMEGLCFIDGDLYTLFESATYFYHKKPIFDESENPTDVVWKIDYQKLIGKNTDYTYGDTETTTVPYKNGTVDISFKQSWFSDNSLNYNHSLAQLSSQFVMLGYNESSLKNALSTIGMNDISYDAVADVDMVDCFIANRPITVDGEEYTLIFTGFIGTNTVQWYSNFDPGSGSTHQSFNAAKNYVHGKLEDYIETLGIDKSKTKILVCGHSRGAATANLVSAQLIKDETLALKENIYTYTFATPKSTTLSEKTNSEYKRIFNIVNPEDFVTKVIPAQWDYGRYGTTYTLPSKNNTASYNVYLKNMRTYFNQFTGGDKYTPFIFGEADTYNIVKKFTSKVKSVDDFYNKELKYTFTESISPDMFFNMAICPLIAEKDKSSEKFIDAVISFLYGLINPITDNTYTDFCQYFLTSAVLYEVNKLLNNTETDDPKIQIILELLEKIDMPLDLSENYFEDSHCAETYCAYMMSMNSHQTTLYRSGYKNTVNCPVDIEVIDNITGEVVAKITNNEIDEEIATKENALVVSVDGDSKSFWIPSDGDYEVKLTGNDNGTMDYSVAEINEDSVEIARVNFDEVEIVDEKTLTGSFETEDFFMDEYALTAEDGKTITSDDIITNENSEDYEVTLDTTVNGLGNISGAGTYTKGDYVTLNATTDEHNSFLGWYENDELISNETTYSFVIKSDKSIAAKFTSNFVCVCGETIDSEEDFTAHSATCCIVTGEHDYTAVVTVPTCTEQGYTTFTCSCGDSFIGNYLATLNHNYVITVIADPTCTEQGYITYTCSACKDNYTDNYVDAIGHTPSEWEVVIPAEIGIEGLEQQKCTVCGEVLDKRVIPALEDTAPSLLGDVNGDGEITASDARLVLRFSAELDVPTEEQAKISDVNGDGTITASDARKILRISAELE